MIKCSKKRGRLQLALMFALVIFIIMVLTSSLLFILFSVLRKAGIFDITLHHKPMSPFFVFALFSVLLGTIIAIFVSRIPLAPLREIIDALDRLAQGDFDVRIHLKWPRELQRFSTSFNHMVEELGSIEMLRSDFINNFSHEFKTPIVSVRGFAKILKYEDLSEEEKNEYLDIIISEADRLTELATNVLNLSKIENQTIVTDKVSYNVSEQIRRVIALLESKWSEKNIEIAFDCEEIYLYGNEELLNQVWINMIDNAIKFSPCHKVIKIDIMKEAGEVIISVTDQGEGMKAETVAHIFDKFYQGDSSHATKGNGLGLALVKRIVDLHEGEIKVANTDKNGTTFEVRIKG